MLNRIIGHLDKLISFDTQNPPRSIDVSHDIFAYINSVLEPLGTFTIKVTDHGDGRVSYFAIRGAPKVLFNVHLDTVPIGTGWTMSALKLTVTNGRAYGRGSCDIKGAAATLLALAEQVDLPMALLFTTDEEGANSCCIKKYTESMEADHFDIVVVAEPTECQATVGHKGYLSVLGEFLSQPGHSSEARGLVENTNHQLALWASAAIDYAKEMAASGHDISFNIGSMSGGGSSNVIASKSNVHWSARLDPDGDTATVLESICNLTEFAKRISWNARFQGPPLPTKGKIAALARQVCARHNLVPGPNVDFWTEAALFARAGQPVIVLGPGNIEQAHAADEWVGLDQLTKAAGIYRQLLKEGPSNG